MDYSLQDIPVFIINLPKSIDRKAFMKAQCESIGISPIFIDAVYGKNLSNLEVAKYCDQITAKKLFGRELILGEIGCALSHKKIYQRIVDENIPYAIILEDDAVIKEGLNEVVKSILDSEVNWDLVLLGHNKGFEKGQEFDSIKSYWGNVELSKNFALGRVVKGGLGAFGYIISRDGAHKILGYIESEKIQVPIDKITSNSEVLNIYGLFPPTVSVDLKFESEIENQSLRGNDRDGELIYEIAKLVKKTPFFNVTRALWFQFLKIKPIKKHK